MQDGSTAGNTWPGSAIRWCPSCTFPLKRRVDTLSGHVSWWTTFGAPVDLCPRCFAHLPHERPEIALVNLLLAERGEPRTCAEELERLRGAA